MTKKLALAVVLVAGIGAPETTAMAAPLSSTFFASSACAASVMSGTPYDMNDAKWIVNNAQNRDICAYKFFAAFFMLGYDTSLPASSEGITPVRVLHLFQAHSGLPAGSVVTPAALTALDKAVAAIEPTLAARAKEFPLHLRLFQLHPNDVSPDTVAAIYGLALSQLPAEWTLPLPELLRCISGQCVGDIVDLTGKPFKTLTPGPSWRYLAAYFDVNTPNGSLPRASVHVATVVHEFAHYVDGRVPKDPQGPHSSIADTYPFYRANYLFDKKDISCAPKRYDDPKDWTTWYGYLGAGGACPAGQGSLGEEWAEAVSMYVGAGTAFRVAAAARPKTNGRKYLNIKDMFHGVEFATNLARAAESGCSDTVAKKPGPGYATCDIKQVFDWTLPKVKK